MEVTQMTYIIEAVPFLAAALALIAGLWPFPTFSHLEPEFEIEVWTDPNMDPTQMLYYRLTKGKKGRRDQKLLNECMRTEY